MPLFEYIAIGKKGKKVRSAIDADNLQDAKLKLIRRQIAVLGISSIGEKPLKDLLKKQELLNLTRELSRLLHAGLPLFEALSILEEKYRGQRPHRILLNLADRVRSGYTFSQGLAQHPHTFDLLFISMVRNAEKTGSLAGALDELGDLLAKQLEVRKQITAALLYPAILCSFCLIVLSSLLFFVIPSLKELFDGRSLHPFTRIVFFVSDCACYSQWVLVGIFSLGLSFAVSAFFSSTLRTRLFSLQFRAPFVKTLFAKVAFVRFARATATLLEGGLPIIETFDQARRVMNHPQLESVISKAAEQIAQGEAIHAPFENHPLIPPLIPRMLSIAEEGGKLPFMMKQIAQIYEEELEKTLTHFTTVAQPVLLLVLGVIIGFVLLSVLLPMTDVSSFAT
ncbi:MAG: hypothetical protein A3D96_05985 [Chlamydiae bacterium RIFCSPHIGHO2_12_FULL_44_59]|nr:MAG: hypothetical protein A2796_03810 [Chlamydiae bacterium RIFCSPHIGHO2_01_FULL_44_39]OGN57190.1 MAG: hypothetical protein A3C42_02085 [Chlamydiae bacterium RIFCSPHIGHO2_02_FULL_45_9]OGN61174.1 MAG: hypothetical protein A3D96_05985 [Chlamydiae bacterium RIFCSPHIGHO2_12_FULL_44_59]OGN65644.1 MAG: hypothetical protein A2978_06790 [Chlamydiae bacterium RIFCSPLOWO2_01_FULL_44_52]OGN68121.1 MAG: hypothetical protein A3I67_05460 [Chlamydiae bacterium RIFCSPLOWO2_02_FULL_45_22]OGN69010.1 MAG: hyp